MPARIAALAATPVLNRGTLDSMAYEDFKALIDGKNELEERMDNKVCLFSRMGLFQDSDCINIEIKDKNGNVYDYVDCLRLLGDDVEKVWPLFDTAGWNPESKKHQDRAEKFVDFVLECDPAGIGEINVSINPYHPLYVKAEEYFRAGDTKKAEELEKRYAKRMANVLFTFTPLVKEDYPVGILARAIPRHETSTGLDNGALFRIVIDITKYLKKMYENDLRGEQKYVHARADIDEFVSFYYGLMDFSSESPGMYCWGRAENLYNKNTRPLKQREEIFKKARRETPWELRNLINPNGSLVLSMMDISAKTDLEVNFKDKDRPVKPFRMR